MTRSVAACVFAFCIVAAVPAFAQSQTETFMLLSGVPGDVTEEAHKNWIRLFSIGQTFSPDGKSDACSIFAQKGIDSVGPMLWAAAVTGQQFTDIRIDVVKRGEPPYRFYELRLTNARISSISNAPSEGRESVTLTALAVTLSFFPPKPDGAPGTAISSTVSCR